MIKWEPFFLDEYIEDDCSECTIVSDNKLYYWSFVDFWSLWASIHVFDYKITWDNVKIKCTDFLNCGEENQEKRWEKNYVEPENYVNKYWFWYQIERWIPKWWSFVFWKSKKDYDKSAYFWVNQLHKKVKWHNFDLPINVKAYLFYKALPKEESKKKIEKIINDLEKAKDEISKLSDSLWVRMYHRKDWNEIANWYSFDWKSVDSDTYKKFISKKHEILKKYWFNHEEFDCYFFIMEQLKSLLNNKIDPERNYFVGNVQEMFDAYNKEELNNIR